MIEDIFIFILLECHSNPFNAFHSGAHDQIMVTFGIGEVTSQFVQEFLAIWSDGITWMSGDKWDKWDNWDKRFALWKMAVNLHHGDQDLQMYLVYLLNQSFHVFHCRF